MKIGTRSILFGAHCFLLHPWFVFAAWWKLYGFPWDPRLWVAFFVHDLGYWGKPNMDGKEGETHPELGAIIMHKLFDHTIITTEIDTDGNEIICINNYTWYDFCYYHSRFLAKQHGKSYSRLCVADKLSICLTPYWLYLPMVRLTGEVYEYMKHSEKKEGDSPTKYASMKLCSESQKSWYLSVQKYIKLWVDEHKDGKEDRWTPNSKQAINKEGVWK
jgi:hypothetical protein